MKQRELANHHCWLLVIMGFGIALVLLTSATAQAQNLRWVKQTPGGRAIAVDSARNSYVTGFFSNSVTFGPGESNETTLLNDAGDGDIYIAKYDSTGLLVWAKRAGGTGGDAGSAIAVDGSENIYITGYFGSSLSGAHSATFGLGEPNQTTLISAGTSDMFVAKYDTNGMLVWAKRAGGGAIDVGRSITVDSSGNSYVTGDFGSDSVATVTFGPGEANQTILTSAGGRDIFVAKYNTNGTLAWAKRAGGPGKGFDSSADSGNGIAVDSSGSSYVTGTFGLRSDNSPESATFGSGEANQTILTSAGEFEIFVAKYASNGLLQWAKRAGGTGRDLADGIALDALGNSYVTGTFVTGPSTFGPGEPNERTLNSAGGETFYVAKYSSNGALVWAKQANGASGSNGIGIAVDNSSNSYVTGAFVGSTTFGQGEANETTLSTVPVDDYDGFVAKYDSNGVLKWVRQMAGLSGPFVRGIALDGQRNSYVIGSFFDSATFGPGEINETTLIPAGSLNAFLAKFSGGNVPNADFDGDGESDIAVYETSTGNWFGLLSTVGFAEHLNFGGSNFLPVPADYDGDGVSDTAVYDTTNGNWFIDQSTDGFSIHPSFGGVGFIPVPGDYDGDGKTDIGVYQTSTGHWFYVGSTSGFGQHLAFGGASFVPVPGDYDGDGMTDTAVYDMTNGNWFINQSTAGFKSHLGFGGGGYLPIPGDYDGDGKTDTGVYQTGTGHWFYVGSTSGFGQHLAFGGANFTPVPADYDGDGTTDTAVYDTTNGNWFIDQSTDGLKVHPAFGGVGYVPVLPQVTILRAMGLL